MATEGKADEVAGLNVLFILELAFIIGAETFDVTTNDWVVASGCACAAGDESCTCIVPTPTPELGAA